jgi:hypothetical protein
MAGPAHVRAAEATRFRAARTAGAAGGRAALTVGPARRRPRQRLEAGRSSANAFREGCPRLSSRSSRTPRTSSGAHGVLCARRSLLARRRRQRGALRAAAPSRDCGEDALHPLRGREPRATYRPRFCVHAIERRRVDRPHPRRTYGRPEVAARPRAAGALRRIQLVEKRTFGSHQRTTGMGIWRELPLVPRGDSGEP